MQLQPEVLGSGRQHGDGVQEPSGAGALGADGRATRGALATGHHASLHLTRSGGSRQEGPRQPLHAQPRDRGAAALKGTSGRDRAPGHVTVAPSVLEGTLPSRLHNPPCGWPISASLAIC